MKKGITHFIVGIGSVGDNQPIKSLFERGLSYHLKPLTIMNSSAICSRWAKIGPGSALFPGNIVNVKAGIGSNVIVNSGAIIKRDCVLGNHVYVATGVRLAGGVNVGSGAHIDIGASIRQEM